jgi:hypothetical protein
MQLNGKEPHVHHRRRRQVRARMKAKKVILLAATAVLIYTLLVHPTMLGDGVQQILSWIGDGLGAIVDFMKSVVE